jgi:hypothetical protein
MAKRALMMRCVSSLETIRNENDQLQLFSLFCPLSEHCDANFYDFVKRVVLSANLPVQTIPLFHRKFHANYALDLANSIPELPVLLSITQS